MEDIIIEGAIRLLDEAKRDGTTHTVVAKRMGIGCPYLSDLKAGRRTWTLGMLCRLCDALDVEGKDVILRGLGS